MYSFFCLHVVVSLPILEHVVPSGVQSAISVGGDDAQDHGIREPEDRVPKGATDEIRPRFRVELVAIETQHVPEHRGETFCCCKKINNKKRKNMKKERRRKQNEK